MRNYREGDTVIAYTDGRVEPASPADGKHFSLEEMQKIVGGDIKIAASDDGMAMVLNETGRIDHLPPNAIATAVWRGIHPGSQDRVLGTVLFCKQSQLEQ